MTQIILDGKDKVFYTKCLNCATEFTYQLEDVQTEETEYSISMKVKTVICPSCGEKESAMLLTKEEYDKIFRNYPYGGYYGGCGV